MPSAPVNAERRQRQIAGEIAKLGLFLPGSLGERTTRCGSPRCRCHSDPSQLHGPYPTWIRNVGAKTVTRTLSPSQLERYRLLFDNTKRLRELTGELEALSAQVVEQAEGWTQPRTSRARHSGDGGDTAIDNVSTPRPETPRRLQRRHPNSGLR
jgi:Family of unknown function (DUF6788)